MLAKIYEMLGSMHPDDMIEVVVSRTPVISGGKRSTVYYANAEAFGEARYRSTDYSDDIEAALRVLYEMIARKMLDNLVQLQKGSRP